MFTTCVYRTCLQHMFTTCLQHVYNTCLQDMFTTCLRHVFAGHLYDMHVQNTLYTGPLCTSSQFSRLWVFADRRFQVWRVNPVCGREGRTAAVSWGDVLAGRLVFVPAETLIIPSYSQKLFKSRDPGEDKDWAELPSAPWATPQLITVRGWGSSSGRTHAD